MRILVTGGAGFISSAVTDTYLAARHDVTVADDLSAGSPDNLDPRARLYRVEDGLRSTWEWFATRASGQAEGA